jgi:hypothetical protein
MVRRKDLTSLGCLKVTLISGKDHKLDKMDPFELQGLQDQWVPISVIKTHKASTEDGLWWSIIKCLFFPKFQETLYCLNLNLQWFPWQGQPPFHDDREIISSLLYNMHPTFHGFLYCYRRKYERSSLVFMCQSKSDERNWLTIFWLSFCSIFFFSWEACTNWLPGRGTDNRSETRWSEFQPRKPFTTHEHCPTVRVRRGKTEAKEVDTQVCMSSKSSKQLCWEMRWTQQLL